MNFTDTSRRIGASTLLCGVVGHPVRHSLSPLMHNAWLAEAGIDAVYLAFEPAADGFAALCAGLHAGGARGLNVTLPFKAEALGIASARSVDAVAAGAANTLIWAPDGYHAETTDGPGFVADLDMRAQGWREVPGPAVVLGAGGAGRSLVQALAVGLGRPVILVNRTLASAQAVAAAVGAGRVQVMPWERLDEALSGAALVVNATSMGLKGASPLQLDMSATNPDALIYDTVYQPRRTAFLEAATGRRTLDGLGMLAAQGALAFQHWFGLMPDVDAALRRLARALEDPA